LRQHKEALFKAQGRADRAGQFERGQTMYHGAGQSGSDRDSLFTGYGSEKFGTRGRSRTERLPEAVSDKRRDEREAASKYDLRKALELNAPL